jgi:hypothetical protein
MRSHQNEGRIGASGSYQDIRFGSYQGIALAMPFSILSDTPLGAAFAKQPSTWFPSASLRVLCG